MAVIWKGRPVAAALNEKYKKQAQELRLQGITPTLAILCVGKSAAVSAYEKVIYRRGEAVGVNVITKMLPQDVTQLQLLQAIEELNQDASIHGVLMMKPLPKGLSEAEAGRALDPRKDVDGITEGSLAGVFSGAQRGFTPCTSQACVEILDYYGVKCVGKRAAVLGRSLTVGRPAAMLLLERNATVTICHSKTENLAQVCRESDILVVGIGAANLVDASCMRPGQFIVDAGINVLENGDMVGDVDYDAALENAGSITPVSDGVGTVTTTLLMGHVVEAAQRIAART